MTKEEANAEIAALVDHAYETIRQAEALADEHKLSFTFSLEYGMGGRYSSDPDFYGETGWIASSANC